MIISSCSESELLRLSETSFGTRVLVCFHSFCELKFKLDQFKYFLEERKVDFTFRIKKCEIDLKGSKIMFIVVTDKKVKDQLAGILLSSVILNDVNLSKESIMRLQNRCRKPTN